MANGNLSPVQTTQAGIATTTFSKEVLVARDIRTPGEMFENAVVFGLASGGRRLTFEGEYLRTAEKIVENGVMLVEQFGGKCSG